MLDLDYASRSISNIRRDSIVSQTGFVDRNDDGTINIGDKSQCSLLYSYDTEDNRMMCKAMRLDFRVDSEEARSSRYNTQVAIDLTIQYYEESFDNNGISQGYIDGNYQFTRVIPQLRHETNGYINSLEIECENKYIKYIGITLSFYSGEQVDSEDIITFRYVNLFNSRTTEQMVTDTYGWSAVVNSITVKTNGYELGYEGEAEKTSLLIDIEDIDGTPVLTQIIVNSTKDSEKVIPISYDNKSIPRGD